MADTVYHVEAESEYDRYAVEIMFELWKRLRKKKRLDLPFDEFLAKHAGPRQQVNKMFIDIINKANEEIKRRRDSSSKP